MARVKPARDDGDQANPAEHRNNEPVSNNHPNDGATSAGYNSNGTASSERPKSVAESVDSHNTTESKVVRTLRTQDTPQERLIASRIDKDSVLKCLGEAWRIKSEFPIPALESLVTIIVIGPQSAGKTSFVERYLGIAFSVVDTGIATKRPTELITIPPDQGTDMKGNDMVITASEADAAGNVDVTTTRVFTDLLQLAEWVSNNNKVTKDRLVIKMTSARFQTPRRIIDLPGLRISDIKAGDEDVREVIRSAVVEQLNNPNAVLAFCAPLTEQACNSPLVQFVQVELNLESVKDRMLVILTKCDMQLPSMQSAQLLAHVSEYMEAFGGAPVYMTGFTFPDNVDSAKVKNRDEHYKTSNLREEQGLAKYRPQSLSVLPKQHAMFWNHRTGFPRIVGDLENLMVLLDHPKLKRIADAIDAEIQDAEKNLLEHRQRAQATDISVLKKKASELVHAVAKNASQLSTGQVGYATQNLISNTQVIKDNGKTLKQEEDEFMSERFKFTLPDISDAFIDYVKSSTFDGPDFEDHLRTMQEMNLSIGGVDEKDKVLLPWAAKRRIEQWFAWVVLEFVKPCIEDNDVLLNVIATGPELSHYENGLLRVKRLCDIYAARLRAPAQYYVQRLAYLKNGCVLQALQLQLKDKEMCSVIESLGGREIVFKALEEGYRKELLKHCANAYMTAMGDLDVVTQQLGEFREDSYAMRAISNATTKNKKEIFSTMEPYLSLGVDETLKALPAGYEGVRRGVKEALGCIHAGSHHDFLPATVCLFINRMIDVQLLTEADKDRKVDLNGKSKITNMLVPLSDDDFGELLGFVAAMLANCIPRFTSAIMTRSRAGAWMSSELPPYSKAYEQSMEENLERFCLNDAWLENQRAKNEVELKRAEDKVEKLRNASRGFKLALFS
mmetsp:Transcript_10665/g.28491  ORF Transcript_10665/g.28491 Transcript_10665/m.28491 type:complete len:899 (+) Transcript_10665:274-2970(+)|eukprot:CAMPEP_0185841444 /NCGR_PEP_ID=MMETSP1353-20130828/17893_1 /TAXON_ID=1077150 /ORGANISM="Erythrolobus australicus, Strain CCMP3124" /LENGTH=898 /DNA_ID=CAMNT_0028540919 /DNA_START=245 /DNA_END=2941 /DNA_ORIENTATION=+